MNILTIIVLLVILAFALNGYRKGFIRVLASMCCFFVIMALVYFMTPYINTILKKHTPVYDIVQQKCMDVLESSFAGDSEKEDNTEEKKTTERKKKKERKNRTKGEINTLIGQKKYIEDLNIPERLKKDLINNNNDSIYKELGISTFQEYLAKYMADIVLNIITFVVTLILANIIWGIIMSALYGVSKLPGIHGINQYAGCAFGLVQGVLLVWIVLMIISIFGQTESGQKLLTMVHESFILETLYNLNPFMKTNFLS